MVLRVRSRSTDRSMGTCTRLSGSQAGTIVNDGMPISGSERVEDHVSPGDCHDFFLRRTHYEGGIINTVGPDTIRTFSGYMTAGMSNFQMPNSFPGQKPNGTYASEAAARTNPSRPYVDVPVSVFELGDLTHLLKDTGSNLIKRGAGKYLEYKFLWEPLVSDLVKLTRFHEQVARRVKEIEKLASARGLRRTVEMDRLSYTYSKSWKQNSNELNTPYLDIDTVSQRIIKIHLRWKSNTDLSKMPRSEAVRLAKKSVLGLTADLSTLWELLPWSWLIDWGWNVGSFLKAHRNIIPATLDECLIIQHTTSRADTPSRTLGNHHISAGFWEQEVKERRGTTAIPVAHFPFLTGSQMGIVSALAITRMK